MKKVLILVLFLTAFGSSFAQKGKPLYKAAFGVQAYTFRNQFPKGVEATLDTVKMLGFTELEGGGAKGVTPEDFKKMCDARGIKIPSVGS